MSAKKEMRALLRRLRKAGYYWYVRGSGHYAIHTEQGLVIASATPGGHSAVRNTKADLRRRGVPREVTGSAQQIPHQECVVREWDGWSTGRELHTTTHDFHLSFWINHLHLNQSSLESSFE